MKFIKLDRRHNLYSKGYRFAFRFQGWSSEASRVERAVKDLEGYTNVWDNTFWGKPGCKSNGYASRSYYVGVRNESTGSIVALKVM
jgi:hypothetical protein